MERCNFWYPIRHLMEKARHTPLLDPAILPVTAQIPRKCKIMPGFSVGAKLPWIPSNSILQQHESHQMVDVLHVQGRFAMARVLLHRHFVRVKRHSEWTRVGLTLTQLWLVVL